ncbi:hypothetical protein D5F01_LYC01877 [Larimichthys crocea]|uniref:Uncharacterized protein n=1 Tax=Larimichthys crocea TaxID=215358 RepID=A0A6G0J7A0_LARCR|nr:hypothetical protein D5F01_LYC01877 [Larimichthys crocea]
MEREELEFKIDELQMNRESAPNDQAITLDPDQQEVQGESQQMKELRAQCGVLTRERDTALAECQHMRDILQSVETELGEKTKDFVLQYKAMKEQGANTVQELQDKLEQLIQERDELLERVREVTEDKNNLMKNVQDLELKLEASAGEDQKLQSSVEEQTTLACELKQSVKELTSQNEEILSKLQMKKMRCKT